MGISQEDRSVTKLLMHHRLQQQSFAWLLQLVLKQLLKFYTVYESRKRSVGQVIVSFFDSLFSCPSGLRKVFPGFFQFLACKVGWVLRVAGSVG